MVRVVVTGGAGFIGSYVVDELRKAGHVTNIFDYADGNDIRDAQKLHAIFTGADAVVHLAAFVSVPESLKTPEECRSVNVDGTELVFSTAKEEGVKRLVYASSAAVYGDEPSLPKREDTVPAPKSPYAESKLECEKIAQRYHERGLSSVGLRFFNVYGPGQNASHESASVIPKFIAFAKAGKPITITGNGLQTRDFVHARDVARAVVLALGTKTHGICNIASGQETKIIDLVKIIQEKYPVAVEHKEERLGDILRSVADISRAKHELGWEPQITFVTGMRELLT